MSARPNIYSPQIDQQRDELPGYRADRAGLGTQAGAERLGMSLWVLPPGQAAYPYHLHLVEEEMLIVLKGSPTLRTPDSERVLERGEVVAFLPGTDGAHQVINDTDEEVRFLAVSTSGEPDIVLYPDTGKISASERRAGGIHHIFRIADEVGYYEGMDPR